MITKKNAIQIPPGKEICHDCNGKGKDFAKLALGVNFVHDCKTCSGTGFVDKKKQ